MADWPEQAELAQVLNISDDGEDWETTLTRVLAAAISRVKVDVGNWEDDEDPTDSQAQAALRMAELISTRPTEPLPALSRDPAYRTLLKGSRRKFGVA